MPTFEAELSDGRIVTLEADRQPTEQDILAAIGNQKPSATEALNQRTIGPLQSFLFEAAKGVAPTIGSAIGAGAGAAYGSELGPWGALGGGVVGALAGGWAGGEAQDQILKSYEPEFGKQVNELDIAARTQHPIASALGTLAAGVTGFQLNPGQTFRGLKALPAFLSRTASPAEQTAAKTLAAQVGVGAGIGAVNPLLHGQMPTAADVLTGAAYPLVFGQPRFGVGEPIPTRGPRIDAEGAWREWNPDVGAAEVTPEQMQKLLLGLKIRRQQMRQDEGTTREQMDRINAWIQAVENGMRKRKVSPQPESAAEAAPGTSAGEVVPESSQLTSGQRALPEPPAELPGSLIEPATPRALPAPTPTSVTTARQTEMDAENTAFEEQLSAAAEAVSKQTGVPTATVEKGIRVEAHDHPDVAKSNPEILPTLVRDELKLDKAAYDKDKDPIEASKSSTATTGEISEAKVKEPWQMTFDEYVKSIPVPEDFDFDPRLMKLKVSTNRIFNEKLTLGSVIDYPELFERFPFLREVTIESGPTAESGHGAWYDPKSNKITLGEFHEVPARRAIIHEVQHAIDNYFDRGQREQIADKVEQWSRNQHREAIDKHYNSVKQAVSEGKQVSTEVLAEYPDLQRKTSPVAQGKSKPEVPPTTPQAPAIEKALRSNNWQEVDRLLQQLPEPDNRGPYTYSDATRLAALGEGDAELTRRLVRGKQVWQWIQAVRDASERKPSTAGTGKVLPTEAPTTATVSQAEGGVAASPTPSAMPEISTAKGEKQGADIHAKETVSGTTYQYRIQKHGDLFKVEARIARPDGTFSEWESGGWGSGRNRYNTAYRFVEKNPEATFHDPDFVKAKQEYDRITAERESKTKAEAEAKQKADAELEARKQAYESVAYGKPLPPGKKGTFRYADSEGGNHDQPGKIYGDLAIHKAESKYDSEPYKVSHVPTGLKAGPGYATLSQAKRFVQALINSGLDLHSVNLPNETLRRIKEIIEYEKGVGEPPKPQQPPPTETGGEKPKQTGEMRPGAKKVKPSSQALGIIPPGTPNIEAIRMAAEQAFENAKVKLKNTRATLRSYSTSKPLRELATYTKDVASNQAHLAAKQLSNDLRGSVRRALNRPLPPAPIGNARTEWERQQDMDQAALNIVVESGRDLNQVQHFENLVRSSTAANRFWKEYYLRAIEHARSNWAELQAPAQQYAAYMHQEWQNEIAHGIEVIWRDNYVPHAQDLPNEFGFLGDPSGEGTSGFRHARAFRNNAESIAAGVDPITLNAADVAQARIASGQMLINNREWLNIFKRIQFNGRPIVGDFDVVHRRPPLPSDRRTPAGYTNVQIGVQHIPILDEFANLFQALSQPSWFRGHFGWNVLLKAAAGGKHFTLMLDTFHLGRIAAWEMAIKPLSFTELGEGVAKALQGDFQAIKKLLPIPSYEKGGLMVDYSANELTNMAARGEIDPAILPELLAAKSDLQRLIWAGYNIGKITDVLHQHWVQAIPVTGRFNKWLFDQFVRGAMVEVGLMELQRYRRMYPNLSQEEIARRVAKDLNVRFGNLGRQGILKSRTMQDIGAMLFLAQQWNEALIRSETGAVTGALRGVKDTVKNRRLQFGVLPRATGAMAVGIFLMGQIINYITRGKPTWENPEEGAFGPKISGYIPDVVGGGPGFFLNPMSLPLEITHLLSGKYENTKSYRNAVLSYLGSRQSTLMRPGTLAITGKDAMGRNIPPDDLAWETFKQSIPLPIGGSAAWQAGQELISEDSQELYQGQYQKQLMASIGMKTDQAPSPERRIQNLAREFNRKHDIQPSAEFYTGTYSKMISALRIGNTTQAIKEYQDILGRKVNKKTPEDVVKHMLAWPNHPYTGNSDRENEMYEGLSDEQKATYAKARQDRVELVQRFFQMLDKLAVETEGK